uniref:Uncharacterized protein n=1 Tax=Anguilla anguilla TaxID=7936 RepID=A0A0E9QG74_ANGAN
MVKTPLHKAIRCSWCISWKHSEYLVGNLILRSKCQF